MTSSLHCRTGEMPATILKARTHRAQSVGAVTIDTVVHDEQLRASRYRFPVSVIRISKVQESSGERKSDGRIFVVKNEAETDMRY